MAVANLEVKKIHPKLKKISKKSVNKANKKNTDVLLLEQELKFAKVLAGNDKKLRDRVLKNLRKWLGYRSQSSYRFKEEDFMRIWKGLFYCMWMSDKPLVQEELAENISMLIHSFTNVDESILFFDCYLKTMVREWFGIDMHRLNKFMMFVRRMLRQCLVVLDKHEWKAEALENFGSVLLNTLFKQNHAIGLLMHFIDVYIEEVAKASKGNIDPSSITLLLKPFAVFLAENTDPQVGQHISQNIFITLLQQSDAGIEYQEKYEAWKKQGFPGGSIDCMQKVEIEDEGDSELEEAADLDATAQDPRAGRVDVVLPQIPFDAISISEILDSLIFGTKSNVKSRKQLRYLVQKYKKFSEGEFSLGPRKMPQNKREKLNVKNAVAALEKFEQELYADSSKNRKKKNIKKEDQLIQPEKSVMDVDLKSVKARKRKSNETFVNGVVKKVKENSNKWKVENLNDSLDESDISIAPSNEGSVLDISSETVSPIPRRDKKGKHKIDKTKDKMKIIRDVSQNNTQLHLVNNIKTKTKTSKNKLAEHENANDSLSAVCISTNQENKDNKLTKKQIIKIKKTENIVDKSTWDEPLQEGEIEYFVPSRKKVLKKANAVLKQTQENNKTQTKEITKSHENVKRKKVTENTTNDNKKKLFLNPFAVTHKKSPRILVQTSTPEVKEKSHSCITPKNLKTLNKSATSSEKRVKIVLKHNSSQNTEEYVQQLQSSPQIPFDAERKPMKTSLKPSVAPSRINPYYKFQDEIKK